MNEPKFRGSGAAKGFLLRLNISTGVCGWYEVIRGLGLAHFGCIFRPFFFLFRFLIFFKKSNAIFLLILCDFQTVCLVRIQPAFLPSASPRSTLPSLPLPLCLLPVVPEP